MEAIARQGSAHGLLSGRLRPERPPDAGSLSRDRYDFEYVRREFVGEIRCLLFDVSPVNKKATGALSAASGWKTATCVLCGSTARIRIARPHDSIFISIARARRGSRHLGPRFHLGVEESQPSGKNASVPRFKAQTRLWGYNTGESGRLNELASIAVEADKPLKDETTAAEISPLESQRAWERQAEINIVERLEKAGLLAPAGPVDDVLNTVINNLIVTKILGVQAAGRVLLTTPLETFSVGQTIVISRGLLDVLPDEASLAMVLSDELAHIALGHRTDTHYAFSDQTMLGDADLLKKAAAAGTLPRGNCRRRRQGSGDAVQIAVRRQTRQRGPVPAGACQPLDAVAKPDPRQPRQWPCERPGNDAHGRDGRQSAAARCRQAGADRGSAARLAHSS